MSITAVGSRGVSYSEFMASRLQSEGLSVRKTALVLSDAKVALDKVSAVRRGPIDKAAMRDALESRIAADVASGKLSKEDAQTVKSTLDQIDQQGIAPDQANGSSGASPGDGAGGKGPHGGGHGGGGDGGADSSANKTELSETVTLMGKLKKTTILYTDGTSETTTKVLSDTPKDQKLVKSAVYDLMKANASTSDASSQTKNYLATLDPGSLFNISV